MSSLPKLVVFDVDGTLIPHHGTCSAATLDVLNRLRAAEIPIAVATGRPLALGDFTLDSIGGADWLACGNGASLMQVATGELLRDACLPADLIEPVVRGLRAAVPGIGFTLELTTGVVEEPDFVHRVPPSPHDPPVDDVLAVMGDAGVRKIICFHSDYDDRLGDLAAHAQGFIDERCQIFYGMLPIVEVATAGESKAVALQVLVEHLGVDPTDVLAFGDGGNDVEMLQWAGVGVAMGNASDAVKATADAVTESVDSKGVAAYLDPLLDAAGL